MSNNNLRSNPQDWNGQNFGTYSSQPTSNQAANQYNYLNPQGAGLASQQQSYEQRSGMGYGGFEMSFK